MFIADEQIIKRGDTTDIYFKRTQEILKRLGIERNVYAEFTVNKLPKNYEWAIFCGLEEVLELFEGIPVKLSALPEGTLFKQKDINGIPVPVMTIEGNYRDFAIYETPALGFICQSSGIATKSARIRVISGDRTVLSFGIRRMHPAITPMIDRSAYIGGCDGVSSIAGADTIGEVPKGTMPHSLIIVLGEEKAWKVFDDIMPPDLPRIVLIDTYGDEKEKAIRARELIDGLKGVRLDTPASRRGDIADIVREIRWELDIRGFKDTEIFVSGGLDEDAIIELKDAGASGFGVGTSISNAPTIDFAMDITAIEEKPVAKKGKFGGVKDVFRCPSCLSYVVKQKKDNKPTCPRCQKEMEKILITFIEDGKRIRKPEDVKDIRRYVLKQLSISSSSQRL